jgi:putative ABC transport system ATP-binding protein
MRLQIEDLVVEYRSGGYVVRPIDHLSADVASGELVLLLGPSGCGKTTLLCALAGILSPTSGHIRAGDTKVDGLAGRELTSYRRSTVGIVFQSFNLVPSLTAAENVQAVLSLAGVPRRRARARARELIELVGLGHRAHHRPGDLSGGEQQRVATARALAHDPPILLADEPTAHLDQVQVEEVLSLLRRLASPGRLVVVATHDPRLVPLADRVINLGPEEPAQSAKPFRVTVAAGEVLFHQNDQSDCVYVVERGAIDIIRILSDGSEDPVASILPGSYFGELGPLFGLRRSATARAAEKSVLTAYSPHEFRKRFVAEDGKTPGLSPPHTNGRRPRPARKSDTPHRDNGQATARPVRATRPTAKSR